MKIKFNGKIYEAGKEPKTMKPQHTPLPWKANDTYLLDSNGDTIGKLNQGDGLEMAKSDAAFIVRAVNAHDELIGTLHGILMAIEDDVFDGQRAREVIEAALAKAESK